MIQIDADTIIDRALSTMASQLAAAHKTAAIATARAEAFEARLNELEAANEHAEPKHSTNGLVTPKEPVTV